MSPNAPSSPQWTFNDFSSSEERSATPAAPESGAEKRREPETHETSERAEQADIGLSTEDAGPKESRKGWWQRRFKM
jgi:hypothetical protein